MRQDLVSVKPLSSSFLACEKDIQYILQALFVGSKPYSDILKRLLIINEPDCLDKSITAYQDIIDSKNLATLRQEGYIKLNPKVSRKEHEDIKSYIILTFDNFTLNPNNPAYKDFTVTFDIICYNDAWELDNYKIRPLLICGYIDGILNSLTNPYKGTWAGSVGDIRLSGIGEYQFLGCQFNVLDEDLGLYTLMYNAVHFTEDIQKDKDEE